MASRGGTLIKDDVKIRDPDFLDPVLEVDMDARHQPERDLENLLSGKNQTPSAVRTLFEIGTTGYQDTGNTVSYVNGERMPMPHSLTIAQLGPEFEGYYLFYHDDKGDVITDTYHDSVDAAFRQAAFEYDIPREAWTAVDRLDTARKEHT
jgi:hypothetical protein